MRTDKDRALDIIRSLFDDDDNNNNDDDDNNEACEDEEGNYNGEDSTIDMSWVGHWINKPPGERGHRNREEHSGWGKTEIEKVAGITDAQYSRYMVSFVVILAVEHTDSFLHRNPRIFCAIATSTPQRPLPTTT